MPTQPAVHLQRETGTLWCGRKAGLRTLAPGNVTCPACLRNALAAVCEALGGGS